MDNISVTEMMALSQEISKREVTIKEQDLTIRDLRAKLCDANKKIDDLQGQVDNMTVQLDTAKIANTFYHTFFVLQKEKVKRFFASLRNIQITSLFYTFLVKTLPDNAPKELIEDINELATIRDESGTNNFFGKDSRCFVSNGDIMDSKFGI